MNWSVGFVLNSVMLGVGLAMDAFSVSMANGLRDPGMGRPQRVHIAGTFAFFQFLMPMIGWICVHTVVERFSAFQRFVPWIAMLLLGGIGGKMIAEGLWGGGEEGTGGRLSGGVLLMQGVATSIDALSVGFTIAEYGWEMALTASLIIAVVTFAICLGGLLIGRVFGTRLSGKASILGGVILVAIGLEILLKGIG